MGNAQGKASVTSSSSRAKQKKSVHWRTADRPYPPNKPQVSIGLNESQPDVITILWTRPQNDGGSPITGYQVEHRRMGSTNWVRSTPILVTYTDLSLVGLEPGWRYQFRVTAHNAAGASDPSEVSDPLTVTFQKNLVTPPRFTEELHDTTALENDKVEFLVHITGTPPPKVSWYKDGFEIFSSRRTKILTENDQSVLVIHQAALSDEGEIKCTATNRAGHATCKANLSLEAPPRIRLPRQYEDGLLFEKDETIRLKVSVAGKPAPEVSWTHDGQVLNDGGRYEIINAEKVASLKIVRAIREDRGEYQVHAVNKLGEDVASFLVTITDKPVPPGKPKIVMTLGKSATLQWTAPEDDGGCKIGSYMIEYYRIGWNVWLKAATSRKLTATLGDLIEGSEYKFRIKAENPYGVSDASEESDTIFIPDPKRGLFEPSPRGKSETRDIPEEIPQITKRRRLGENASISSSKSSVDSRTTSPLPSVYPEPRRPKRIINEQNLSSITPEKQPSPLVGKRNVTTDTHILDRSSLARELSYGSPDSIFKRNEKTEPLIFNRNKSPEPSLSPQMSFSRSRSPSPSPRHDNLSPQVSFSRSRSPSPSPMRTTRETLALQISFSRSRSPSPSSILSKEPSFENDLKDQQNVSPDVHQDTDMLHGSSEFMLVLFPGHNNSQNKQRRGSTYSGDYDPDEILIPPPMSLSAPELGSDPPYMGTLRNAISSTELLHEKAMARFYQAVAAEEAELAKRRASMLASEVPRIRINSLEDEDNIINLERRHSLRRRLSGGGVAQLWQKRLSLKTPEELAEVIDTIPKLSPQRDEKVLVRQRSASEEREEEVFEQVRQKMASKKLEDREKSPPEKQSSIEIADEDKWEEETVESESGGIDELSYEESISVSETDEDEEDEEDFDEEEELEEEESEDERMLEDLVPPHISTVEEETYHPRLMISREPVVVITPPENNDAPFEILNKPSPLPDPNFVPKPILKRRNSQEEGAIAKNAKKVAPTKPARKFFLTRDKTSPPREKSLSPLPPHPKADVHRRKNSLTEPDDIEYIDNIIKDIEAKSNAEQKKTSPSSTPTKQEATVMSGWGQEAVLVKQQTARPVVVQTAREMELKRQLEARRSSIEEAKVVIDHYSSIINELGKPKRQPPRLLLSHEALKAAAESQKILDEDDNTAKPVEEKPKIQENAIKQNYFTKPEPTKPKPISQEVKPITSKPTLIMSEIAPIIPKSKIIMPEPKPVTPEPKPTSPIPKPLTPEPKPLINKRHIETPDRHVDLKQISSIKRPQTPSKTVEPKYDEKPKKHVKPTTKEEELMLIKSLEKPKTKVKRLSRPTTPAIPDVVQRPVTPEAVRRPVAQEIVRRPVTPEVVRRPLTPNQEQLLAQAEDNVKSTVSYLTDVAIFMVACWFYLFKSELLAIPPLGLMLYRHISEGVQKFIPRWLRRNQNQ